jgi:hypothetical protein
MCDDGNRTLHGLCVHSESLCDDVEGAGEKPGEKVGITRRIMAIGFGLSVLLTLDFNRDEFLCVFFWMHKGWRLSTETFF